MGEANGKNGIVRGEDGFNFIAAVLWRRWKLVCFGTLAATALATAISFFIPKSYRSEGFYQLGYPQGLSQEKESGSRNKADDEKVAAGIGIPLPLFKKSASQFINPNRLVQYALLNESFAEKDLRLLRSRFQTAADIQKWISPVYAFSKGDLREIAQLPKDESNAVIGLNLSFEAHSRQQAYRFVRAFGEYVRDCLLYISIYDYIKEEYSKVISGLSDNENGIIDLRFKLAQNARKMQDIRGILTRYPEAARMDARQLVSVQEQGFRFLDPITQVVGIESTLADQRRELADRERQKEELLIRRRFFSLCNEALNQVNRSGNKIFSRLKAIQGEVFQNMDLQKDAVRKVHNVLRIDLQSLDLAFFTNCRFLSGPTFPSRHVRPSKSSIVILAFLASFCLLVLLAFVLHGWQDFKRLLGNGGDRAS